ncbi:hypothetical protein GRF59_08665 [Paenibacillus sp. HJL G12]|uniref:Uncharacterized protein n=1 Tax=Paenibacillus dendrobii TaxID=2691084 RepID=A0A7X3IHN4_9BACL|nr:hypothetical protein [Paenibacillus dendrobii]MWV43708.1 hypothetical protein [Paenibacillus dendrobii]
MIKNVRSRSLPVIASTVALCLSIALSACGTGDQVTDASGQDASKETNEPVTTPHVDTPEHSQTPSNGGNPYEVAGIDNPDKFKETFESVQKAVSAGNKEQVAGYILYPLRVNENGKSKSYKDKSEFIADYDHIMTDSVKKALADQKLNTLFVNYQGVMVGNGEIWFGASTEAKDTYGIIAINKDNPGTSK